MNPDKMNYRLNLASRPFVNNMIPYSIIGIVFLALIIFAAFNLYIVLNVQADISGYHQQAEEKLAEIEETKAAIGKLDRELANLNVGEKQGEMQHISDLLLRRKLSWTRLFDRLEETLPPDVRMIRISPSVQNNIIEMSWRVEVKDQAAMRQFLNALEESVYFDRITLRSENPSPNGGMFWELTLVYHDEM